MLLVAAAGNAHTLESVADALAGMAGYEATVTYAVTLPQADDDVVYTVDLQQPADADSYLIDWSVESPSGPVEGFTAWFDGHFYNFRNRRLQEHHDQWDAPAPAGTKARQDAAQFASLLPSRLARQLREIASSGSYTCTIASRGDEIIVEAARNAAGEPDAEMRWTFDSATCAPREFYADYNPGSLTGQQVKADYSPARKPLIAPGTALSEKILRALYPDAFGRYRESQFAIENLRGEPMPAFSLPDAAGGRLTRRADEPFENPTAVVIFDPEGTLSDELIAGVRNAIDRLPLTADVIWACTGKNPATASDSVGERRSGETTLTGAAALAVECGAAALPVVMVCGRDGRIRDLIIGLNNSLESDVMRMLTAANN